MKLITNPKNLTKLFQKNLKWCKDLSFATAWASPIKGIPPKMLKAKIKLGIVGLHFYQTNPKFIESFIDHKKVKFIKQQTSGVFHPKMYLFEKGDEWRLIIGSANFTNAAFSKNTEICLLVSSEDKTKNLIKGVQGTLKKMGKDAEYFTQSELEHYELIWSRHQHNLHSLSGIYGDNI